MSLFPIGLQDLGPAIAEAHFEDMKKCAIAFVPFTILALGLRMYSRVVIVRGFGLDDVFLLMALAFYLVLCGIAVQAVHVLGTIDTVISKGEPMEILVFLEKLYARGLLFNMFFIFSVVLLKVSLAVFFLRIIVRQWQRVIIYTATAIMTVYGLGYAFLHTFRCGKDPTHPIQDALMGKCLPDSILIDITFAFGGIDVTTDMAFALMPVFVLWSANMPRSMKVTAGLLLSFGSISCICAIVRTATLVQLKFDGRFMYNSKSIGLWSIIEPGFAMMAISMAACRPLWRQFYESETVNRFLHRTATTFRWSGDTAVSSDSAYSRTRSTRPPVKPSGMTFVTRSEGFKRFNDSEYGLSLTTVTAGNVEVVESETQDLRSSGSFQTLAGIRALEAGHGHGWGGRTKSTRQAAVVDEVRGDHGRIHLTQDVRVNVSDPCINL